MDTSAHKLQALFRQLDLPDAPEAIGQEADWAEVVDALALALQAPTTPTTPATPT